MRMATASSGGTVTEARMRMGRMLVFPLLLCLFLAPPVRAAGEDETIFRADVHEVRVAFAVSDRSGGAGRSLESSDVAVVDDEWIIRRFRSFQPASETALELVLLLDASGSVESELGPEIARAKRFLQEAAKAERDRVSILIFGGMQPRLLCLRNCLEEVAPEELNKVSASGQTPLYDAVVAASSILRRNRDPEVRPAMILFSDGRDTVSRHALQTALRSAQVLGAPIYSVSICGEECESAEGNAVLARLASETGGIYFQRKHKVQEVLRRVLDDLHSGYVLTYQPPSR